VLQFSHYAKYCKDWRVSEVILNVVVLSNIILIFIVIILSDIVPSVFMQRVVMFSNDDVILRIVFFECHDAEK
jgi:hypothetical protein